jgi:hypothetical protein
MMMQHPCGQRNREIQKEGGWTDANPAIEAKRAFIEETCIAGRI